MIIIVDLSDLSFTLKWMLMTNSTVRGFNYSYVATFLTNRLISHKVMKNVHILTLMSAILVSSMISSSKWFCRLINISSFAIL